MTNETVPAVHMAADTMHGDLMQLVVDELKAAQDVWQKLTEGEQADAIDRIRSRTAEAVTQCVEMIAMRGFTSIRAKVDSVTVKDGIKAVLTLSQHDNARHALFDSQGASVYLVLADPDQFAGGTETIKPDPDQGALVLSAIEKVEKKVKDKDGGVEGAA